MKPMAIRRQIDLTPYNTFAVAATANYFAAIASRDDLRAVLEAAGDRPRLILGGGSNILFTRDFDGLVIRNEIRGIRVVREDRDHAWVRAGAGEDWDAFVRWTLYHRLYGLENLASIPGAVGASPVQNIGAYGVEIGDCLEGVDTIDLASGAPRRFQASECALGYRTSIFKQTPRDRYFITAVTFRLSKTARLETTYGDVARAIEPIAPADLDAHKLSDIIRHIRRRKLPDPAELGNAGSFFKNPQVGPDRLAAIVAAHGEVPHFAAPSGRQKIAAGWLIEQCGWKGRRVGACGVYPLQALILVNYGGARGAEIWALARDIAASVKSRFGIELEPEPRII
jgi:UDP-N-acetylmuramate dehydrogenase